MYAPFSLTLLKKIYFFNNERIRPRRAIVSFRNVYAFGYEIFKIT